MLISDLDHLQISDLTSLVAGGFFLSRFGYTTSDFQFFSGLRFAAYRATIKAIARGHNNAVTSGYAYGRIFRTRSGIVSVSSSRAFASAE